MIRINNKIVSLKNLRSATETEGGIVFKYDDHRSYEFEIDREAIDLVLTKVAKVVNARTVITTKDDGNLPGVTIEVMARLLNCKASKVLQLEAAKELVYAVRPGYYCLLVNLIPKV